MLLKLMHIRCKMGMRIPSARQNKTVENYKKVNATVVIDFLFFPKFPNTFSCSIKPPCSKSQIWN